MIRAVRIPQALGQPRQPSVVSVTNGSEATKPLPEAGVWGWEIIVNDAKGGEYSDD